MWKIAVKYQVGLSEIISANPQVSNPALIYPGQVLNIPLNDEAVSSFEQRVIELTNQKRVQNGLKPLTATGSFPAPRGINHRICMTNGIFLIPAQPMVRRLI